jgi:hypothetical protein
VEPASEAALEELICVTEEDGLTTAPTALFRQQAELPVEMTTVMVPVAGRVPEKPVWEARLLAAAGAPDGVRGVWVRHDERRATLVGCAEAGGAAFELSSGAAIPAQGAWTVARLRLDGGVWTLVNAINAERTN